VRLELTEELTEVPLVRDRKANTMTLIRRFLLLRAALDLFQVRL